MKTLMKLVLLAVCVWYVCNHCAFDLATDIKDNQQERLTVINIQS